MFNSEKIKPVAIAIIELQLSEGKSVSQSVGRSAGRPASQPVENSVINWWKGLRLIQRHF